MCRPARVLYEVLKGQGLCIRRSTPGAQQVYGVSPIYLYRAAGSAWHDIAVAERWTPVVSFDGIYAQAYEVSDHGLVQSIPRHRKGRQNSTRKVNGRILSPRIRDNGVRAVNLWHENAYRQVPVKVLILEAFVGPCPPGHEAKCVDGDEANLALSNLAYKAIGKTPEQLGRGFVKGVFGGLR